MLCGISEISQTVSDQGPRRKVGMGRLRPSICSTRGSTVQLNALLMQLTDLSSEVNRLGLLYRPPTWKAHQCFYRYTLWHSATDMKVWRTSSWFRLSVLYESYYAAHISGECGVIFNLRSPARRLRIVRRRVSSICALGLERHLFPSFIAGAVARLHDFVPVDSTVICIHRQMAGELTIQEDRRKFQGNNRYRRFYSSQ